MPGPRHRLLSGVCGIRRARQQREVTGIRQEKAGHCVGFDVGIRQREVSDRCVKVEVPVQMEFVQGTKAFKGEAAYTRTEALQHFKDAATTTHKPFIYLSAGVSNPVFIETLELAVESGTSFNGVLCGRATWKDGIAIYAKQGAKAFEDWLNTTGVENITNVNNALKQAHSWHEKVQTK